MEVKKLVPELRFKGFDGEWKVQKFSNHTNSISSGKIKPNDNILTINNRWI